METTTFCGVLLFFIKVDRRVNCVVCCDPSSNHIVLPTKRAHKSCFSKPEQQLIC